ncbi:hypothetical protein ISS40_04150 [Candidatus Bathyarchaeota archaeon]|nr:hypothetical protein [Candidatus Bathyarchaeota archaeon]
MGESDLHGFLKRVGAAFLINQGCFLVDTEVPLSRFGQTMLHDLDEHHVIDVCGVGERFFRLREGREELGPGDYEVTQNILRGVEVKVSRGDFRNGFVCTACNFNYVLTPMRLVSPWEVPRGVGLVEFNRYKFDVELTEEDGFRFRGLRVVKKASFRRTSRFQVDNATAHILRRTSEQAINEVLQEIREAVPALVYSAA